MMRRRGLLRCVGAMAVAGLLPGYAFALDYPIRAARVIVPFPPGGGADITGRLIAQWLSDHLGQALPSRISRAPAAILAPRPSSPRRLTVTRCSSSAPALKKLTEHRILRFLCRNLVTTRLPLTCGRFACEQDQLVVVEGISLPF